MFREESVWIKNVLDTIRPLNENNKVANFGSSTKEFRTVMQPHIEQNIFLPLQKNGWDILHIDFKKENGVDIVADLTDRSFAENFKNKFALTLCTNMLEHVVDIHATVNNLLMVTQHNGYLLITVPFKYRIHHDPIDNGYRPTPDEIVQMFSKNEAELISETIIVINEKKYYRIRKSKIPFWGYRERLMYHLGKRYKVSGVLLKVKHA